MRPEDRTSDTDGDLEKRAAEAESESPEQIREQIEHTRGDMGETIDAIQDRLNPDRLKEHVKETVREATIGRAEQMVGDVTDTARQTGYGILDRIRDNPVPAAMVGLGVGWLLMRGQGGRRHGSRPDTRSYRYDRGRRDAPGYAP